MSICHNDNVMDNNSLINIFEMLVTRISDMEERLKILYENDQVAAASGRRGLHIHGGMFGLPFVLIREYDDFSVNDVIVQVTMKNEKIPFEHGSVLRKFIAGDPHLRKAFSDEDVQGILRVAKEGFVPLPGDCGIQTDRFSKNLERLILCKAVEQVGFMLVPHGDAASFVVSRPALDLFELTDILKTLLHVVGIAHKDVKHVKFVQSTSLMTDLYRILSKDLTFVEHMQEAKDLIRSHPLCEIRPVVSRTATMFYEKTGTEGMLEEERQTIYDMLYNHKRDKLL